ncbi:hypothetical protein CYMTET_19045 [Cymbomonas tetramitiformis]|uniref:Uncharacterized protein n=1 Tax=Cymbomonas tetramitiformis TaxID=36881 RepID=A0AAE0L5M8_9CHLO|nr:hypothetical protein CYMTET_19045 [Cymbomonas tetramitiformis]
MALNRLATFTRNMSTGRAATLGEQMTLRQLPGAWVQVEDDVISSGSNEVQDMVTIRVGWSDEQLDEVGDVHHVEVVTEEGSCCEAHSPVARLHWEGFQITAADELYHTQWANATGVVPLTLPSPTRVIEFNKTIMQNPGKELSSEEESWIVRVEVSKIALQSMQHR